MYLLLLSALFLRAVYVLTQLHTHAPFRAVAYFKTDITIPAKLSSIVLKIELQIKPAAPFSDCHEILSYVVWYARPPPSLIFCSKYSEELNNRISMHLLMSHIKSLFIYISVGNSRNPNYLLSILNMLLNFKTEELICKLI